MRRARGARPRARRGRERGDYEAALATFEHPRYEYVATDEVYDGAEEVMAHWRELDRAFPDQLIEIARAPRTPTTRC